MTDDELREAYRLYRAADERSLIVADAKRRGLLKGLDETIEAKQKVA